MPAPVLNTFLRPPFLCASAQAKHWANLDGARKLYEQVLATATRLADVWIEFAQLEW